MAKWQRANAFHAEPDDPGEPYAIVIPPPNVTSALHMGHALNNTLQDILIRWRRMQGRNTVWMPGTDHAGIATQTVVEKRVLLDEGKRRTDFERDQFVAKIQAWKDQYEARITDQLKAMGCSCDWDRQRFTMDPICTRAVREAFFRLFQDGLIYRGKRLVNWDPVTQTALADDEVEMREIDGHFWYLKYPVLAQRHEGEQTDFVTVATTRPETMLGDTAVAMHPSDPRAQNLVGKHVRLPIVNRIVPIIADEYVVRPDPGSSDDMARYSTGFLKITPAHDPNDWEVGQRHGLGVINVLAPDGTISNKHGWPADEFATGQAKEVEPLLGMRREQACHAVVDWFDKHGLLAEIRPYRHAVGHSYRSHVPIEPYLSDQWYVQVTHDRLAGAALRAMAKDQRSGSDEATKPGQKQPPKRQDNTSREGQLRFHPARYAKTFQDWHENIRDWCISRQLWWGHRIPVWSQDLKLPQDVEPIPTDRGPNARTLAALDGAIGGHWGEALAKHSHLHHVLTCEAHPEREGWIRTHLCLDRDDPGAIQLIENAGWKQEKDVLDTWFSSALWPLSTMGWPHPNKVLRKWNPTNLLCTAREIITLWVSRMVMFNLYFHQCLPFTDVFVHAMIQDGQGQKMSKSLGNGVDPVDIIYSHGSDAMRFTLASMTTQTQDVRLPVDMICSLTGETFTPQFTDDGAGHRVAAPIQICPSDKTKKMVSSYGVATGKVAPSAEQPLARNTSEKFDIGRNFANKLWNAVRFALGKLQSRSDEAIAACQEQRDEDHRLSLTNRWILSRLATTVRDSNAALEAYEFKYYTDGLYDFVWRDFCDWYVEAVKPTIDQDPTQQKILASLLDVILRLLHPVMPYITEKLWERLNETVPQRGAGPIEVQPADLLVKASWPKVDEAWIDAKTEAAFKNIQQVVTAIREVRTTYKVPPRKRERWSAKSPAVVAEALSPHIALIESLSNATAAQIGPDVSRPEHAASSLVGDLEIFVHDLIDSNEERRRLSKRLEEVRKNIGSLESRLRNKGYVERAPAHLVQQTRDQLAIRKKEATTLVAQLAALD